jgi:hypothetical protein
VTGPTGETGPAGHHHHHHHHRFDGVAGEDDLVGGTGMTGGVGSPTDPPVNQNTLLGSWDNGFLHGTDGSSANLGSMPDASVQSMLGDLTSLIRELTNILSSLGGTWSADGNNGQGMGTPLDGRSQGSVGSLDDGGQHHHHQDLWKPNT